MLRLLALAAVSAALTALTAGPAHAAAPSCARGGATVLAAGETTSVVAVRTAPRNGYATDRVYACSTRSGRRVLLFSSTRRDRTYRERDGFSLIDDRHVGVTRTIVFGIGSTSTASVYDVRTGKAIHTTAKCTTYALSDTASGYDAVVFLPGGGMAYTCGRLTVADAAGERDVEPEGSVVSHLAAGDGRLYWTLTTDGKDTVKSLDL